MAPTYERVAEAMRGTELRYWLYVASQNLGQNPNHADAEDAVSDFVIRDLPRMVESYDPTQSSFKSYQKTCFQRACWAKAGQRKRLLPLDVLSPAPRVDEPLEIQIVDPTSASPELALIDSERLEWIREALEELRPAVRLIRIGGQVG